MFHFLNLLTSNEIVTCLVLLYEQVLFFHLSGGTHCPPLVVPCCQWKWMATQWTWRVEGVVAFPISSKDSLHVAGPPGPLLQDASAVHTEVLTSVSFDPFIPPPPSPSLALCTESLLRRHYVTGSNRRPQFKLALPPPPPQHALFHTLFFSSLDQLVVFDNIWRERE